MALQSHHVDRDFYKQEENKMEVTLEVEKEATAAAEDSSDKLECQDTPNLKDNVISNGDLNNIDGDIKEESYGSQEGSEQSQLEKQENSTASVPLLRRTRPRIQLGYTPKQLNELERVFEKIKYPDESTRRELSKRLYLGESKVRSWFKRRRAKYRKTQEAQMLNSDSSSSQNTVATNPSEES